MLIVALLVPLESPQQVKLHQARFIMLENLSNIEKTIHQKFI
jgi:hypothetical protein